MAENSDSSLLRRLKALGINIPLQTETALSSEPSNNDRLEFPGGAFEQTEVGEVFVVTTILPTNDLHGNTQLKGEFPGKIIAQWSKHPELANISLDKYIFIDVETTGLISSAGTYTFLIGAARFIDDNLVIKQLFLSDPSMETAQLSYMENWISPTEIIVSFNGKSFDIPMLRSRFAFHRWPNPFAGYKHLDLLHLARKLWKLRLPDRSLGQLEIKILNFQRDEIDVPGWMIADLYQEYLLTGNIEPLNSIFYHNKIDVVSMAALLNHIAGTLKSPLTTDIEHELDLLSIARLHRDLKDYDVSIEIYEKFLSSTNIPANLRLDTNFELGSIYKRIGDYHQAEQYWIFNANLGDILSCIELAKYYEHKTREYLKALDWTKKAISHNDASDIFTVKKTDLDKRLARLTRKIQKNE